MSFESRYGTWLGPADGSSDMTTLPSGEARVDVQRLLHADARTFGLLDALRAREVDQVELAAHGLARRRVRCTTVMVKTVCERDETAFILARASRAA